MTVRKWIIAGIALSLPMAAFAQANDVTYCKALATKWRTEAKHDDPNAVVATAVSKCDSDAKSSIPVLEKALTDAKVPLPPRT